MADVRHLQQRAGQVNIYITRWDKFLHFRCLSLQFWQPERVRGGTLDAADITKHV